MPFNIHRTGILPINISIIALAKNVVTLPYVEYVNDILAVSLKYIVICKIFELGGLFLKGFHTRHLYNDWECFIIRKMKQQ